MCSHVSGMEFRKPATTFQWFFHVHMSQQRTVSLQTSLRSLPCR